MVRSIVVAAIVLTSAIAVVPAAYAESGHGITERRPSRMEAFRSAFRSRIDSIRRGFMRHVTLRPTVRNAIATERGQAKLGQISQAATTVNENRATIKPDGLRERLALWNSKRKVTRTAFQAADQRSSIGDTAGARDALQGLSTLQASSLQRAEKRAFKNAIDVARRTAGKRTIFEINRRVQHPEAGDLDLGLDNLKFAQELSAKSDAIKNDRKLARTAETMMKGGIKMAAQQAKAGNAEAAWQLLDKAAAAANGGGLAFPEPKARRILVQAFENNASQMYKAGAHDDAAAALYQARAIQRSLGDRPSRSTNTLQKKLMPRMIQIAKAQRETDASSATENAADHAAQLRMTGRLPKLGEARRFMKDVVDRERRFYQPGIAYDAKTGLTFDGHAIDRKTGQLVGKPRNWSAASKESLHIVMLAKAIAGDPTAQSLLTPDPARPELAVSRAREVLRTKIETYKRFHEKNPGFGGFLPWFKVERGEMAPMEDWKNRVPGLDNGQLAWSMYMAEGVLREHGETKLADAYREHVKIMADNVVGVFYDPKAQHFRGESVIGRGAHVPADKNSYETAQGGYHIKDAYEGLMLVHFADQMGSWRGQAKGAREAPWRDPRRVPAAKKLGRDEVTVVEGQFYGSHEEWGFLVLPTRDVPVADRLFHNNQRVRTQYSAKQRFSGLFAPTHEPIGTDDVPKTGLAYVNSSGVPGVSQLPVRTGKPIFAPYAAFPLALVDERLFTGWLKSMVDRPGMLGPYGIGESYSEDGHTAPLLTWDGKALPMIARMGGIAGDVRRFLKRDGKYDAFLAREKADYRLFDESKISGETVPFHAPPPLRGERR